ncbi:unnamed protein product [Mytilus coruscus]|uniref:Tc1-like transposase DDE domain-containing protein n=1 Tax=Mytilus coruscus TaxID=42192 RepID=A0A6J8AJ04_MYTCO|nr:unnamed protein product [Mytilus coruscus]
MAYATGFSEKTIQRHTNTGSHDAVQEVVQSLHESAVKKQVAVPKKLDDFDKNVSKTSSSDYHNEMIKEHFTEWFKDTLLPKLPPQSVIMMDNAPYHSHLVPDSRVPNTGSRKPDILAWLDRNNIDYPENAIKAELLEFVMHNKPCPRYVIDELAAEHGHEVLRLPPRHCGLNPIEMVWADLKGYVARRNSTYKKKDIIDLFNEAKSHFNKERWAKFETHVSREVEEKLWLVDGIRDDEYTPYIIDMTEDDNDDSDIDDDLRRGGAMTWKLTVTWIITSDGGK